MPTLMNDLRYALRVFARQPGFTAAAVLSLALGIGVNTALFSVVNALLLSPLPYADADRLTILWNRSPGLNITEDWFSTGQYFDIRNGNTSFEDVGIAFGWTFNLTDEENQPERVSVIRVSSSLLPMLGARAIHGRLFGAEDDVAGRAETVVLSHGTWVRRYGSDPGIVGRAIRLNGEPFQIVGVLEQGFSLPTEVIPTVGDTDDNEIFMSFPMEAGAAQERKRETKNIVGKLKPGISVDQAQAEMDRLTARLRQDFPANYPANGGLTFSVVPLLEQVVGNMRRALLILMGAVACVLIIACANVANLLLARSVGRQGEITVRAALGATRGRITRQLLTESALLAVAGAGLGLLFAYLGIAWLQALQPPNVPRLNDIGMTLDVLLFTTSLCAVAVLLFGLAPALSLGRLNLQTALRDAGRGTIGSHGLWGRRGGLRRFLVAGEVALSVVLLIGAGLLIKSYQRLREVKPGFDPKGVLTFEFFLDGPKYPDEQSALNAYQQLWQQLNDLPGVVHAGGTTALPLSGSNGWGPISIEGYSPAGADFVNADQRVVGGRYFEAMKIPLVSGRFFDDSDRRDSAPVVIVDRHFAEQFWPGQDALGKRLKTGPLSDTSSKWMTVVGIVGGVKQDGLDTDERVAIYLPQTQLIFWWIYVTIAAGVDPMDLVAPVRRALKTFDPDLSMYRTRTMDERIDATMARPRFLMTLLTLFATCALGLAVIGIYGVTAHIVSQRTRDIGIRIALGATRGNVIGMVLLEGAVISAVGIGTGLAAAWALTRFLQSLLFNVSGTDALTFAGVAVVLATVALIATFIPARRASLVDPITAVAN